MQETSLNIPVHGKQRERDEQTTKSRAELGHDSGLTDELVSFDLACVWLLNFAFSHCNRSRVGYDGRSLHNASRHVFFFFQCIGNNYFALVQIYLLEQAKTSARRCFRNGRVRKTARRECTRMGCIRGLFPDNSALVWYKQLRAEVNIKSLISRGACPVQM